MATKKKKKAARKPKRRVSPTRPARHARHLEAAQAMPAASESSAQGMKLWPLFLLVLLGGAALYYALHRNSVPMAPEMPPAAEMPPAREVAPESAAPSAPQATPSLAPVTRPASPKGNIAGAGVMVWDRSKQSKVTFKVMHAAGQNAEVSVFSSKNRLVRKLSSESSKNGSKGWSSLVWDGKNSEGRDVPAGVYYARISSQGGDVIQELRIF
jgi:hypothetical protein